MRIRLNRSLLALIAVLALLPLQVNADPAVTIISGKTTITLNQAVVGALSNFGITIDRIAPRKAAGDCLLFSYY